MHILDEETDNQYLNTRQDLEENLKSVDYDVWLCPQCGKYEVMQYVNKSSEYTLCPKCNTHAGYVTSSTVTKEATSEETGIMTKSYYCKSCGHVYDIDHEIAKLPRERTASDHIIGALIGAAISGSSRSGRSGGGSFGGGGTAGGGASGSW